MSERHNTAEGHLCDVPLCLQEYTEKDQFDQPYKTTCYAELENACCDGEEGCGICPIHGERWWYHDD